MGYKRKAHIIFLSEANQLSLMAATMANAYGVEWLEGRAVTLEGVSHVASTTSVAQVMQEIGLELNTQVQVLDEALLQWADLVVTMDETVKNACPTLLPGVQLRHYPFPDPGAVHVPLAECRQIRDKVRARIEGMIGGMRLMQNAAVE